MYPHYHTHISTSSNTCIHFIEYVYSHHRTRISPLHYMCVHVYAGTINRTLRLLTVCQLRGEHSANTQRPPTKCLTNTPLGVGADSSCPYPNITKYTYPHYQIRISTLPHTHFPSHLVMLGYGHDESAPTPSGVFVRHFVGGR